MTAQRRLSDLLSPRASRAQIVVALLLALLGFAAVTQVRATQSDGAYAGARRQDLVLLLDSLDAATSRTQAQIAELERTRESLLSDSSAQRVALAQAREQLAALGILAGTKPAVGPGVRITIADPSDAIGASTLLNAIQELRDAGAEAVEVNDAVRVVASTALVDTVRGLVVDDTTLRPPYILDAIGASHTLSEAVVFPGGLADEVEALGGSVRVTEVAELRIDSLHSLETPQYASPTSPGGN
jgi:uncharacterized protein YlxW (UPF0749 family)